MDGRQASSSFSRASLSHCSYVCACFQLRSFCPLSYARQFLHLQAACHQSCREVLMGLFTSQRRGNWHSHSVICLMQIRMEDLNGLCWLGLGVACAGPVNLYSTAEGNCAPSAYAPQRIMS